MNSLNVFFFFINVPSSRHFSPISWPPRMCAIANDIPRSIKLNSCRCTFAEFERAMLKERTKAGLDAAAKMAGSVDADQS